MLDAWLCMHVGKEGGFSVTSFLGMNAVHLNITLKLRKTLSLSSINLTARFGVFQEVTRAAEQLMGKEMQNFSAEQPSQCYGNFVPSVTNCCSSAKP